MGMGGGMGGGMGMAMGMAMGMGGMGDIFLRWGPIFFTI